MGAPAALRNRLARTPLWSWIALIAALGVATAGLGALASSYTSDAWSVLGSDVSKAGVQVVAVGVVGGALTAAWTAIRARREAAAVTEDKIRDEFAELIVLYNGVKSVRRTLRSLGLDAKLYLDTRKVKENEKRDKGYYMTGEGLKELKAQGLAVALTREQAAGFQEQMRVLNELQLGYEAKKKQFQQANLLGEDRTTVADTLKSIESWLNDLVELWEKHGWEVREGTKLDEISPDLQPLFRQRAFRANFSEPMESITVIINKQLFGAPKPDSLDEPSRAQELAPGAGDPKAETDSQEETPPTADAVPNAEHPKGHPPAAGRQ